MPLDSFVDRFVADRRVFAALLVIVIIILVYLRIGLLRHQGFFEPDGFFYYAVIRQTVNNGFIPPKTLNISGFPNHNLIGEAPGLPYITVALYFFLRFFGIGYYDIMRLVPVLFGILDGIGTYALAKYMTKSRWFGLFSMLMLALSNANTARTSATIYRGDTFISIVLLAALILMLKALNEENDRRQIYYSLGSAFAIAMGFVVWNGAPFTIVIYMLAIAMLLAYAFIAANERLIRSSIVATLAGLVPSYLIINLFMRIGLVRPGLQLTGADFLVLLIPLLAGELLVFHLNKRKEIAILGSGINRLVAVVIGFVVVTVFLLTGFGALVGSLSSAVSGKSAIGFTTQELQRPVSDFFVYSYGLELYLAPIGLLAFIFLADRFGNKEHTNNIGLIKLNVNAGFIVVLAYLIIATYMQSMAIRFNSILSIPVAILSAYLVYILGKYSKRIIQNSIYLIIGIFILVAVSYAALAFTRMIPLANSSFSQFVSAPEKAALAVSALTLLYLLYCIYQNRLDMRLVFASLITVFTLFSFVIVYINAYTSLQADSINPEFLNALVWMRNNTPANARVLAVWTDGSVIEGWANRTSYVDSVGGENGTRIEPESRFLFDTTNNTSFLYSIGRPDYVLTRTYWYDELAGLIQEANMTNVSSYYYIILSTLNTTNNGTAQFYYFRSTSSSPAIAALFVIKPQQNGTNKFAAYIGTAGSSKFYEIKNAVLYNENNLTYALLQSTTPNVINNTLLMSYVVNQVTGRPDIRSASVFASRMFYSNFLKLVLFCNLNSCPFGGANVSAKTVFMNNDTKIIHLTYH